MKLQKLLRDNGLYLLMAVLATGGFIALYEVAQQGYRQSANDPQIEMTENAVHSLERGISLTEIIPTKEVAIDSDLSPFMVVYDRIGTPITGSGKLHDALPKMPAGVFEYTTKHGQHRVTWQPQKDVRIASVIQAYHDDKGDDGFVMVGRSLRETENRVKTIGGRLFVAWLISLLCIAVTWFFRPSRRAVE